MTSLDFYCGFDEQFFDKSKRGFAAAQYRIFLDQYRERLEVALVDPMMTVNEKKIYDQLDLAGKNEVSHIGNLQKPVSIGGRLEITLEEVMDTVGIQLQGEQKAYVIGDIHPHLVRLLLPLKYSPEWSHRYNLEKQPANSVCENFVREFFSYLKTTPTEASEKVITERDSHKFQYVAGIDGSFMFWTLAPYVHVNLKERGLSASGSIAKVIKWAVNTSKSNFDDHGFDRTFFNINLLLREKPLGYDERMPSHLKARLLAREVAQELVK